MVDDVFFILRMCSYRALDTVNLQALTAVLGQLNSLLATNLAQALDQRWKVLPITLSVTCSWHAQPLCAKGSAVPYTVWLACSICLSLTVLCLVQLLHVAFMKFGLPAASLCALQWQVSWSSCLGIVPIMQTIQETIGRRAFVFGVAHRQDAIGC